MGSVTRLGLLIAVLGVPAGRAWADPPAKYRWEDEADKHGLRDGELRLLRENKFVITTAESKQVFQAYLGSSVPVFVTADSLLNGFHVLFEESVLGLERAQARRLPQVLAAVAANLNGAADDLGGDTKVRRAALRRAAVFVGTAQALVRPEALPRDADLKAEVETEVKRVTAARDTLKPDWLGPPDDGFRALDYSRFRPRGFYTRTPDLEAYFRAVAWLQAIPFRLDNNEELAAFFLMRRAWDRADERTRRTGFEFWGAYRLVFGGDDPDLHAVASPPKSLTAAVLTEVRAEYAKRAEKGDGPRVNDQIRSAPAGGKMEFSFRFVSAYRLPDAVLFQRTMEDLADRELPTGLEVAAALGSPFARDRLRGTLPAVREEIDRSKDLFPEVRFGRRVFSRPGLYELYLHVLRALLDRTESDAPAFLRADAWKAKSCQTALSGWAQMRHTWVLQAKQSEYYMSAFHTQPGFVEPAPEFYYRLGKVVETARTLFHESADLTPTYRDEAAGIQAALDILERTTIEKLSLDDREKLVRAAPKAADALDRFDKDKDAHTAAVELRRVLQAARDVCELRRKLDSLTGEVNVRTEWDSLSDLCRRLELLAHKQLRRVAFNVDDEEFLQDYGDKLAHVMLYGGNSYVRPRDDAPRVVDVFGNAKVGKHLLVGTGKPRPIWVLYPVDGKDVLCRGAVLPYYEFAHLQRMTDEEWKALHDSPRRPDPPEWMKSLTPTKK